MNSNFFEALHQVATEKGIPRNEIEQIVESAMLSAFKKQYGIVDDVRVEFDRENNSIKIISKKIVVKRPGNRAEEISWDDASKVKKDIELGDYFYEEENPFKTFGRIAAQTAKQVIIQKIKEAEKNIIYNEFRNKEGELINGFLQRKYKDSLYVDLGRTEGVLQIKEQSPLEHYKIGDKIKALIYSVKNASKGTTVYLTRTHSKFIEKLFEMEIPEIYDGIVKIVNIVREPGMRTKVTVESSRDDVDAVGACVGMKGIRIQSIVRELEGEKIDIVEYFNDKKIMAENALTPARVEDIVELSDGSVIALVENEQYKLAVGRNGHNARLASRLCGFEINVKTEEMYQEYLRSIDSVSVADQLFGPEGGGQDETALSELPDIDSRTIKLLEKGGIFSVEDLVEYSLDDLLEIPGIGEKTARKIIEIIEESVDLEDDGEDNDAESAEGKKDGE